LRPRPATRIPDGFDNGPQAGEDKAGDQVVDRQRRPVEGIRTWQGTLGTLREVLVYLCARDG
jgi:hypothetical protein